jgi:glutamyl-tRNA reductase
MVDLAVPRDIEPEVKALEDVYLYTVDDLAHVVQTGHANRQAAVAQAEAIIDAGVQSFVHWMDQRGTVPLIQQLNHQTDEWRTVELARARKLLAKGEDIETVMEALSRGLTQKMLHGALAELHSADARHRPQVAASLSRLFLRGEPPRRSGTTASAMASTTSHRPSDTQSASTRLDTAADALPGGTPPTGPAKEPGA